HERTAAAVRARRGARLDRGTPRIVGPRAMALAAGRAAPRRVGRSGPRLGRPRSGTQETRIPQPPPVARQRRGVALGRRSSRRVGAARVADTARGLAVLAGTN